MQYLFAASFFSFITLITAIPPTPGPITFGNGIAGFTTCNTPTEIINYTLTTTNNYGILAHFWATGEVDGTENFIVEYYIDNEETPSITFTPSLATGQGYPQYQSTDGISPGGLFAAGDLFGKGGSVGGYYLHYKIPFYISIRITVRTLTPNKCVPTYVIARGYEVNIASIVNNNIITLPNGYTIPFGAKLTLQAIQSTTFPPLSLVSLANVSYGYGALIIANMISLSTSPPANNYIEGCWHLYPNGNVTFPGMVIGTGFEDYFSSAYWFGAASGFPNGLLYTHPSAGLTHFSRSAPNGDNNVEELSAYRVLTNEVMGMQNGGRLVWRVGDVTTKCTAETLNNPIGTPSAVTLSSYVWLYTWPNGETIQPLPPIQTSYMTYTCSNQQCVAVPNETGLYWNADCNNECGKPQPIPSPSYGPLPIVGCSDKQCDAFCDSTTVHGCIASWNGGVSLRTVPTGIACGNANNQLCNVPADACAPGWSICLNFSSPSTTIDAFRNGMTANQCANDDPRRFVGAMSHAQPAWSNLPPNPCPVAPQNVDNGCPATGWGSEPICCGGNCSVPSCPNDLWMDSTRIHIGMNEGCGNVSSTWVDGILCCKDTT